jgi:Zn-dependent protease with chaperone function
MSKITAVEWLWNESQSRELQACDFEKALAMEKEQMIHTLLDVAYGEGKSLIDWDIAEQYYNKKFKGGQNE